MPANKVDILFVIDASESMRPCFQKLRDNLHSFIEPLSNASFQVRFGLLAYSAGRDGNNTIYYFYGLADQNLLQRLYSPQASDEDFFTADATRFLDALDRVPIGHDEHTPVALDTAADFPFAPPADARRVIALFTNEKLETGVLRTQGMECFPLVLRKIVQRRITLYAYLPACAGAALMTRLPRSIIKEVKTGADCWEQVDFAQILEQMGRSISASSLQTTREPEFQKAIFGQDRWAQTERTPASGDQ